MMRKRKKGFREFPLFNSGRCPGFIRGIWSSTCLWFHATGRWRRRLVKRRSGARSDGTARLARRSEAEPSLGSIYSTLLNVLQFIKRSDDHDPDLENSIRGGLHNRRLFFGVPVVFSVSPAARSLDRRRDRPLVFGPRCFPRRLF